MNRYAELRMLERAGHIDELERQPRYILLDKNNKNRALVYVADFRYRNHETGGIVVEDVKGYVTEIYKLKKKLFRAKYPDIDFREVKA